MTVRERGRVPGGRLAAPTLHGRRVDLGAAYFSVSDDGFGAVVSGWEAAGLARPWTDTFDVFAPDGHSTKTGPTRWATPNGLRSLARDLHGEVELDTEVTLLPDGFDVTVLAMPDPQAARLVTVAQAVEYEPVIAVAAGFTSRDWSFDAAFVNDDPDLSFVADDGSRRGDGAAVLVLHTTADRARKHLDDPDGAIGPSLSALRRVTGVEAEPDWSHAHRWGLAKPVAKHDEPFHLDGSLGLCGDSWCPDGSPRVESAWLSGHRLGLELASRLT